VNEALLLIGHGSTRYPDVDGAMRRHADAVRAANRFAEVEIALLNGGPSVPEALGRIAAPSIRVVPFFMEDGYFSRVAVPQAIHTAVPSERIVRCPPVGVHDGMAALIEHQAMAACADGGWPPHDTAVLIVGHGSSSAPGRALALHRHAARVAATELFARVEAACLEEPPLVADALAGLRAHPVMVIGFFANHGGHVRDDVPALIAAEQAMRGGDGRAVRFRGCVADDPMMVQIIMDQAGSDPEGE
jgi:sirohydrochlorin cobaltochelatase